MTEVYPSLMEFKEVTVGKVKKEGRGQFILQ